jgi:carboxyl-terminal processing protease
MNVVNRRFVVGGGLAMSAGPGLAAEAPDRDATALQDFDELWSTLGARYCFFGEKATDWARVRAVYRPLARAAPTDADYVEVLRRTLSELYDPHTHLADPPDGSPRFPPYDLWVERQGGVARVVDVQRGSGAAAAGIEPGDCVVAVNGEAVFEAAVAHRPRCLARPDPAAEAWALQSAIAGRRGRERRLLVEGPAGRRELLITRPPGEPDRAVTHRLLPEGVGYIRIPTFAEPAAVAQFDAALADLKDTRGLIIDVRENGGGDTAVARPIMGRFISERRPYASMRRREGRDLSAPWTEWVEPRGPFRYARPVTVLIDRWSASMAEGFPMGMRAVAGARLVGTEMMGLGAAVYELRLDRTGIQAQYSGEPVYTPAGEPRSRLTPDRLVRPTTLRRDEILEAAAGEFATRT